MEPVSLSQSPDVQNRAPARARLASRASASPASRRSSGSARPEPSSSSTPSSSASSTSARSRRARTCRASRRSSTRRSTRSSLGDRRSAPRTSPTRIAETVRERQGALRAEVTIAARYPEHKPAPGQRHHDAGDLHAARHRGRDASAARAGSSASPAQGMTACPCAQELVAASAARAPDRARASREDEIERILEAVPVATHNQRGLGTLHIGCAEGSDRRDRRARPARHRRGLDVAARSTS